MQAFISPYALAKEADVRPQMIYNYIKKGFITASVNSTGKLQVSREEADRWLNKYRTGQQARFEKIQRQLAGE
jgi:predicted site-specific integrase-resolvase